MRFKNNKYDIFPGKILGSIGSAVFTFIRLYNQTNKQKRQTESQAKYIKIYMYCIRNISESMLRILYLFAKQQRTLVNTITQEYKIQL